MNKHLRPTHYLVAFTGTLLALVVGASSVAAYKHLGTTGNTGTHSLTDTRSAPGAQCIYRFSDVGTAWKLRRIIVRAPNVQASIFHKGEQQVGWRFRVDRRDADAFHEQPRPWKHRYTSPIQKARTDADRDASFSAMDVPVRVPDDASSDVWSHYRVIVEVFWYRDDGGVSGTAKMRVKWFKSHFGDETANQRWKCRSTFFQPPG
jgi:hypothetical protein